MMDLWMCCVGVFKLKGYKMQCGFKHFYHAIPRIQENIFDKVSMGAGADTEFVYG